MAYSVRRKFPALESTFITPESQVGYVFKLAVSEDERQCMLATQDRCMRLIDLERFSLISQITPAHDSTITDVQSVPFMSNLWISASNDGLAKVWDSRQPDPVVSVKVSPNTYDAPVFAATVSSSGTCAVSCASGISLFKFGEWRKYFEYTESHFENISCMRFANQSNMLISGGDDGLVNVCNTVDLVNEDNGQAMVITLNCEDSVRSFKLTGSKMYVFSTTESVSVWDTTTGTKLIPNVDSIRSHPLIASDETGWGYIVGMNECGSRLLAGNSEGKLVEFETDRFNVTNIFNTAHSGVVRACHYAKSGTVLTAGEDGYLYEYGLSSGEIEDNSFHQTGKSRSVRQIVSARPY